MNVLHAVWHSDRLHLWAETGSFQISRPSAPVRHGSRDHPFLVGHAVLPEILKSSLTEELLAGAAYEKIVLNLPSTARGPLPSPGFGAPRTVPDPSRKPWTVETLSLGPWDALRWLTTGASGPAVSLGCGDSLAFFRESAQFLLGLLEKGYVRAELREPAQESPVGNRRVAWRPVWEGASAEGLQALADAAPGICFSGKPVSEALRQCLGTWLTVWVQERIRQFSENLLPESGLEKIRRVLREGVPAGEVASRSQTQSREDWKTCFRLLEPDMSDRPWELLFEMQDCRESGTLWPAESLWNMGAGSAGEDINPRDLREKFLRDLARAAALFSPLKSCLQEKCPERVRLTGQEAYFFLQQASLLLKAHAFGIRVPDWWHQKKNRVSLRLKLRPSQQLSSETGLGAVVDYDWEVLAGGEVLSLESFRSLVMARLPLVRLGGRWVEMRQQEIENAIHYFSKVQNSAAPRRTSAAEALRSALEGDLAEIGLPVEEIRAEGWLAGLFARQSGESISRVPVPGSFQGVLRPYQHEGFSWLVWMAERGLGACLADDMGLGKTIQLLAFLLQAASVRPGHKTLLVCPMSVAGNWQREAERFAPSLRLWRHHGPDRLAGEDFVKAVSSSDLVITTYGLLQRDQETLGRVFWDAVVLDEAQNIKNETALQTQAAKSLRCRSRLALTGTPLENRLSELWSILDFLNPGYLGPVEAFKSRFQIPLESRRAPARFDTLRRLIAPFLLRRLKSDKTVAPDLPEKMEMKVYCSMTAEQASLYAAVVQEMMERIQGTSGIQRKGLILSAITRLKQVCNHPVQLLRDGSALANRSGKLSRLREMLEEVLAEGEKALVFTQYAEMGGLLAEDLAAALECEVYYLHGGTPSARRDEMVQSFQEDPRSAPVFVLSTKAGGTGLNLMAANHVFHFDRWWNPSVENQATDRAFRIGQKRNVQVHKLIAGGTLEEKIDRMLEKKTALVENVLASGEQFLTELSDADLKEVVMLNRDAVGE